MLLAAILLAVGLDPALTVGPERFSQEDVLPEEKRHPNWPDPPPQFKAMRDCARLMRVAREVLRERSLDDARVPRGFDELYKLASEEFPSKEAFRAQIQRINDRNENRVEALLASRARPDRDFEIWENRMDPEMTYSEWVRYRLNTTPEQARQQPLPLGGIDDAYLERLRLGGFLKAREVLFQRWLLTSWAPSRDLEARWTDALQDAFFKEALEKRPVVFREDLGCPAATPSLFRQAWYPSSSRARIP